MQDTHRIFFLLPGLETGYSARHAPYFFPFTRTRDRLQYKTGTVFFTFHQDYRQTTVQDTHRSFNLSPGLETDYSTRHAPYFLPFTRTRDRLQYKTRTVVFAFSRTRDRLLYKTRTVFFTFYQD